MNTSNTNVRHEALARPRNVIFLAGPVLALLTRNSSLPKSRFGGAECTETIQAGSFGRSTNAKNDLL